MTPRRIQRGTARRWRAAGQAVVRPAEADLSRRMLLLPVRPPGLEPSASTRGGWCRRATATRAQLRGAAPRRRRRPGCSRANARGGSGRDGGGTPSDTLQRLVSGQEGSFPQVRHSTLRPATSSVRLHEAGPGSATELRAELSTTSGAGAHDGSSASFYARSEGARRTGGAAEEHVKKAG